MKKASEVVDGVDNDCDGVFYVGEVDNDEDGYIIVSYDPSLWLGSSSTLGGGDCDDTQPSVYPTHWN